jgi:hypothetical protein
LGMKVLISIEDGNDSFLFANDFLLNHDGIFSREYFGQGMLPFNCHSEDCRGSWRALFLSL